MTFSSRLVNLFSVSKISEDFLGSECILAVHGGILEGNREAIHNDTGIPEDELLE